VLTEQPRSLTLARGAPAVFRVRATGPGPLAYQWWRGTAMLRNQTNEVLTIPAVLPVSAGVYRVEVSAGERVVLSDPAVLTVVDGSLRLHAAGELRPNRLSLEVRVPRNQSYTLQRSENLREWTEWSRGVGTGAAITLEVPLAERADREAFRLLLP
jgi:hypothetical protein